MKSEYHISRNEYLNLDTATGFDLVSIEWWGETDEDDGISVISLHRIDGPSHIYTYVDGHKAEMYHLLGVRVSKKDFYTPGFIDSFILQNS